MAIRRQDEQQQGQRQAASRIAVLPRTRLGVLWAYATMRFKVRALSATAARLRRLRPSFAPSADPRASLPSGPLRRRRFFHRRALSRGR